MSHINVSDGANTDWPKNCIVQKKKTEDGGAGPRRTSSLCPALLPEKKKLPRAVPARKTYAHKGTLQF